MNTVEEAISEVEEAFNGEDGPERWLRKAREKIEGIVVQAIADGDETAEQAARALLEVHDLTVQAVQCVMVYKLTMDLTHKMQAKKSGLDAATWLGDWLVANSPKKQRLV